MDQAIAGVVIAIVTGIFSVITLLIQRKQNKDIVKIDRKANAIQKEKRLKSDLAKAREELEITVDQIMILILDTNLAIMKTTAEDKMISEVIFEAEQLKNQYEIIMNQIKEINKEYKMLINITNELESSSSSSKNSDS